MNDDNGERVVLLVAGLPVAMAEDLRVLFYLKEALFRGGKDACAGKEISRKSLRVCIAKPTPGNERLHQFVGLLLHPVL